MKLKIGKKVSLGLLSMVIAMGGGLFFVKDALAATGSIYITPASNSVQQGNTITVSIRVNPGTTIDSVQGTLNFDASKLAFQSVNTAGSAFSTELQNTQSGSTVTFGRGDFGAGVSSDALIETVTFKASAGSGSTTLSLSNANADAGGSFTNPSVSGATVSFTTPPATCPAGQVGTPPNCTTPSTGGTGGSGTGTGTGSGSTGSGGSTGGTKSTGGSSSTGTTSPGGSTSGSGTAQTPTNGKPPVVAKTDVQYTQAQLSFTTATPTQLYVRFGVDGQLTTNTPVSDYATSHTITIDPTLLIPGETYTYVAVSTDASGNVAQSAVQHFTTKGIQVKVGVYDSNHKPLKNKKVTIHSVPQTVTTDASGIATFQNVTPGEHHVVYSAGSKSYDKTVSVVNTVKTSGTTQTASPQNFSLVYSLTQSAVSPAVLVWLVLFVLIIGAVAVLAATGRLGIAFQFRKAHTVPLVSQPIVVGGATTPVSDIIASSANNAVTAPAIEDRLQALPNPSKPAPGSTVAPRTIDVTTSDKGSTE